MDSRRSRLPLLLSFLLIVCVACSSPSPSISADPASTPTIEVFFSPRGGATEAVVRELGNAKKEILVQAYSFTSAPIAKALVDAHKRGVRSRSSWTGLSDQQSTVPRIS
jgi:phosphatidylserine/phosphatidylglycerophosphate/cardiolipin synthase-like enzyme